MDIESIGDAKSISNSSCILSELVKERKGRQKTSFNKNSIYLVFYSGSAARHLCLALSTSHPFLDFGEAVGFHSFLPAISFYIIDISEF